MILATAFAVFCIICTVLAFMRHPIWGVYFYLATTYVYPPGRWWGYVFGDLRWAFIAAGVTALAVVFHRGKLQPKPLWIGWGPALCLALYTIWMWIQLAWALDPDEPSSWHYRVRRNAWSRCGSSIGSSIRRNG